ncbi:Pre-mRNA-splicing factor cwc15 [Psilocybe cubensis]|uniref:Cwf15/Cwc15 cell cycle control protein n=2 Tax=Psilocybe cubensis TaxID=181762 RepID=A0A8H8CPI6_PSICU|nr:Pre-mRNA-splicing factor cwc15 [Psilocybe cubensis]KAH9485610.1 Pre-mRNA-splicing factor cwc15 [Psilocybe cubensis]
MSTAHRPTWDPAQAKDVKGGSRQFSVRDMAAHTKLKFRQVGQTSANEVKKRDLRAELLAAEQEARNKKRKAEGKPPLVEDTPAPADEESNKRRKLLEEALELDKDDDDEEEEEEKDKGDDDDESEEDSDEEEDDTAELLRELEKIKRERAAEKERLEREQSESAAASREAEIATANPLLNLAAALGQQTQGGVNTTVPGTFQVKKRWDDGKFSHLRDYNTYFDPISAISADLIFKNQAMTQKSTQGNFVNDLLRTEFHKFVFYHLKFVYIWLTLNCIEGNLWPSLLRLDIVSFSQPICLTSSLY